jgi:hypothetical protein
MPPEDTKPAAQAITPNPDRLSLAFLGLVVAAILAGTYLRSIHLTTQALFLDEVHAVGWAAGSTNWVPSLYDIVSQFGQSDRCIPLVLWDRLLLRTVGLDELGLRLPMWLAGVLALGIFPALVRQEQSRRTTVLFAWLLAFSPILVFYSRMARPYMDAILLGFVAVLAFRHWFETGRRAAAAVYVVCTALTGWLLIVFLPFVLGPFLFYGVPALLRRRAGDLARLARMGIATVVGLGIPLGLPLWHSLGDLTSKAQATSVHEVWGVLPVALRGLLCGANTPLAIFLTVFLLYGWATARRRRDEISMEDYLAFLSILHLAAVLIVGPAGLWRLTVLGRYLIPLIPCGLLLVAAGLGRAFERSPLVSGCLGVGAVLWVIVGSGLTRIPDAPEAFATFFIEQRALARTHRLTRNPAVMMSPFYEDLARLPPRSRVIAELPGHAYAGPGANYQRTHRQEVVLGRLEELCDMGVWLGMPARVPGLNLRSLVHMDAPETVTRRGVSHAVVHRRPLEELHGRWPKEAEMGACIERMTEIYGAPVYEDEAVVVYEVRPMELKQ